MIQFNKRKMDGVINKQLKGRIRLFHMSLSVLFVSFLLAITSYYEIWKPNQLLANPIWWHASFQGEEIPKQELRIACHKILKNPFIGNYHDAFLALEKVGNKKSIPYLLKALKRFPKNTCTNEFVECTLGHCITSLEKLTGMNFDDDYKKWEKWWHETGRYLDFDENVGHLQSKGQ